VVIGTHAVISEAVTFRQLGLAVVDEQHRFGVAQRAALQAKGSGTEPHVLALTATPIPRTLALTFYGDLAISSIHELPPGRQSIRTEVRDRSALPRIQEFLAAEAAGGRQAFVVVPLVVESEALTVASAEAEVERLRAALPELEQRYGLGVYRELEPELDALCAGWVAAALREVDGAYGLAFISADEPGVLVAAPATNGTLRPCLWASFTMAPAF